MDHHLKCKLESSYVPDDVPLCTWYTRKLRQFDKSDYKNHLTCKDCLGNSLLHAAVYAQDLDILETIVGLENVNLDIRNRIGLTPLLLCLNKNFKPTVARCLIEAGCDVNVKYGYWQTTPLMLVAQSYHDIEIAHLLIQHGADINATNRYKNTALHSAVSNDMDEMVSMLLYYGAYADEPNEYDETPFLMALSKLDTDIQEMLLDYVVDVNHTTSSNSLLMVALENNSPFYADLLDMGADVNYFVNDTNCLEMSLKMSSSKAFKRIWEQFDYGVVYQHMSKSILLSVKNCCMPTKDWLECIYLLLTSEHLNDILAHFHEQQRHIFTSVIRFFAWAFYLRAVPEETLYEYICLLLMRGIPVYFTDIESIYLSYPHGKTLKLLLLMDVIPNCCYKCPLPYFMFNFSKSEYDIINSNYFKEIFILNAFRQNGNGKQRSFKEMYYDMFPDIQRRWSKPNQVPRLIELARNGSRKAIYLKLKRQSCCQFYTILRQMHLPIVIEEILSYMQPIYF